MSKGESLIMYGILLILMCLAMAALPKALDHQLEKGQPPAYVVDAENDQKIKMIQEGNGQ